MPLAESMQATVRSITSCTTISDVHDPSSRFREEVQGIQGFAWVEGLDVSVPKT